MWTRIESGKYTAIAGDVAFAITRRDPRLWELRKVTLNGVTMTQHGSLRQAQAHAATLAAPAWVCIWDGGDESLWEFRGDGFHASATAWQEEYRGPIFYSYSLYRVEPTLDDADWHAPNYLGGERADSLEEAKAAALNAAKALA